MPCFFDSQCRIDSSALRVHTCIYVDSSAVLSTCSQLRFISSDASAQRASFCDRQTDRQTDTHTHTHTQYITSSARQHNVLCDRQTDRQTKRSEASAGVILQTRVPSVARNVTDRQTDRQTQYRKDPSEYVACGGLGYCEQRGNQEQNRPGRWPHAHSQLAGDLIDHSVAALLRAARVATGLAESNGNLSPAGFMTHVTCRLTAKNRDQLRNPRLGSRVWASFTFY